MRQSSMQTALAACHEELGPWDRREVVLDSLGIWVPGPCNPDLTKPCDTFTHWHAGAIRPRVPNRPITRGFSAAQLKPPPDRLTATFEVNARAEMTLLAKKFHYCAASP
eukprot:4164341-Alexandrium_andersonii.AAC.1